jgi:IS30 family transposase
LGAVERKSRLYVTQFVPDRSARTVCSALVAMLDPWQSAGKVKTITADNGKEFADPYASWQRGSNEHHNGLLHCFFPKGTDFAIISAKTIDRATMTINSWPRKNLNWKTPLDMIAEHVQPSIPCQ